MPRCTKDQIDQIRQLRRSGMPVKRVAATVGCTPRQVSHHFETSDYLTSGNGWRDAMPPIDLRDEIEQAKIEASTAPAFKRGRLQW